jgi:hypothetical protein
MSNIPKNPLCGYYANQPLLQGTRTAADLAAIDVYCNFAQSRPYGPIPQIMAPYSNVPQRPCACPAGYGFLDTAYQFSAGPNMINLNQALNYQAINGKTPCGQQSPLNWYPGSVYQGSAAKSYK